MSASFRQRNSIMPVVTMHMHGDHCFAALSRAEFEDTLRLCLANQVPIRAMALT